VGANSTARQLTAHPGSSNITLGGPTKQDVLAFETAFISCRAHLCFRCVHQTSARDILRCWSQGVSTFLGGPTHQFVSLSIAQRRRRCTVRGTRHAKFGAAASLRLQFCSAWDAVTRSSQPSGIVIATHQVGSSIDCILGDGRRATSCSLGSNDRRQAAAFHISSAHLAPASSQFYSEFGQIPSKSKILALFFSRDWCCSHFLSP